MRADTFAVIGGGIIGCLVARHLAEQQPDRMVSLIERDSAGAGASRRSLARAGTRAPTGLAAAGGEQLSRHVGMIAAGGKEGWGKDLPQDLL